MRDALYDPWPPYHDLEYGHRWLRNCGSPYVMRCTDGTLAYGRTFLDAQMAKWLPINIQFRAISEKKVNVRDERR